jgi:hypothetical protein
MPSTKGRMELLFSPVAPIMMAFWEEEEQAEDWCLRTVRAQRFKRTGKSLCSSVR